MGTAQGKTMKEIDITEKTVVKKGKYVRNCKVCCLMLMTTDVDKNGIIKCPKCGAR
jgi:hypothetical protein